MTKKIKIKKELQDIFLYISVVAFLLPSKVFAGWKLEVPIPPMKSNQEYTLNEYVTYIYNFVAMAVGIVGVLMFLVGGFQYMISAGNKSVSGEAKKTMINAIIGIVLVLAAYIFLSTINKQLVNFEGLKFD
jgi:O-antigen/teichoic acid export membrane protein